MNLKSAWPLGVLIAATAFSRFLFDTLSPTTDFAQRSLISTWSGISIYLCAGVYFGWSTGRIGSGTVVALMATIIAAVANAAATVAFLALRHDPSTLEAIGASGGLSEQLTLLLFPILPIGVALATVGGALGKTVNATVAAARRRTT